MGDEDHEAAFRFAASGAPADDTPVAVARAWSATPADFGFGQLSQPMALDHAWPGLPAQGAPAYGLGPAGPALMGAMMVGFAMGVTFGLGLAMGAAIARGETHDG